MQSICEGTGRLCISVGKHLTIVPRRFARKPSWLGFAKSKIFRLPRPLDWTPREIEERRLLKQRHDCYMKSLRSFQEKAYAFSVEQSAAHAKEISEDAELGPLMEVIERDNALARERREKALPVEWKQVEENIIRRRTALEEKEDRRQQETEQELQFQLDRLKSAIRLEDLDSKIEEILSITVDHNFGIDRTGKFYFGRLNSTQVTDASSTTQPSELPPNLT